MLCMVVDENHLHIKSFGCMWLSGWKCECITRSVVTRVDCTPRLNLICNVGLLQISKYLGRIRGEKVFLALDNVDIESLDDARSFLDIWQKPEGNGRVGEGSVVVITARSIVTLGRLGIEEDDCLEMPGLDVEQAKSLFRTSAALDGERTPEDERNFEYCVEQCHFSKDSSKGQSHYHPLALKVLGGQLRNSGSRDLSAWVEETKRCGVDKFNQLGLGKHPVFGILRRGYDMLPPECKSLFVDVVLFNPYRRGFHYRKKYDDHGLKLYEWLMIVQNIKCLDTIKKGVRVRSFVGATRMLSECGWKCFLFNFPL
jgi:hypothetical protein